MTRDEILRRFLPPTVRPAPAADTPEARAEAIIRAGRLRRGLEPPPLPPKGSLARRILECAARARGEEIK
jgi:hypothetical protein